MKGMRRAKNIPFVKNSEQKSKQIDADVRKFLESGGVITQHAITERKTTGKIKRAGR